MLSYFQKIENYTYPEGFYGPNTHFDYRTNFRGKTGPIQAYQFSASSFNGKVGRIIDNAKLVWPRIPSSKNDTLNNGYYSGFGVSPPEHSLKNGQIRSSAWMEYIDTYKFSNLLSISNVRVNKILFQGVTATGVEIVFVNTSQIAISQTCTVDAKTIIVSAGAIGTPKLLKLSGVGPSSELKALGINVVSNLPYVGKNLNDHFGVTFFASDPNSSFDSDRGVFANIFYNVDDNPFRPPNFWVAVGQGWQFYVTLTYADSRGTITLSSSNPDVDPILNPNYLSTQRDFNNLAKILNQTLVLADKLGLTILNDPCGVSDCSTLKKLLTVYTTSASTSVVPGYHFSGSCAINKVVSPLTMKVKGTNSLYVVDASVFPLSPGQNTQATTYAVSERAIELVINDHKYRNLWA